MKHLQTTKLFFLSTVIIACSFTAYAQSADLISASSVIQQIKTITDTVPQVTAANQSTMQSLLKHDEADDTIMENRLVQLALAQPNYQQTLYEQKIFEYQLKKQRNSWLNLLSLSTTYNDQSFGKPVSNGTTAYVYPKYYLGVTIPLGLILSNGTDIKITKQSELIAQGQQQELAKSIKASVLSNYKQFKANEKLLAIQNQAVDDQQAGFLQTEQKFRDGTATLEAYNDASGKYNDEVVKAINLQLQQDLIKVELERLIGRKLEDAFK
ncbi:MAG: TolC family protein [Parafilimonas sp.]